MYTTYGSWLTLLFLHVVPLGVLSLSFSFVSRPHLACVLAPISLQYFTAAGTVSRTQFGEDHHVSMHVQQRIAQALFGVGEVNKAIEVVRDVLRRYKRQEAQRTAEVVGGVVQAGTVGSVTSLLYGWNRCQPELAVCRELLKRFLIKSKRQRR